jgi:2-polyprenyl-6-hydroxyphenyl methylase/3-demethylubiquinone-9 3-methyltransferase
MNNRQKDSPETSTAAPEEIARFAAMADEWWDDTGKFKPLHKLNPARIAFIRDTLANHYDRDITAARPLHGLNLLDVGCGGGLISEPLSRLGARITAIDAGEEAIAVATTHAAQSGLDITFRHDTPESLANEGLSYDVVVSLEVVEHVADLNIFLGALADLTKPGGIIILATLNRTFKSLALAKIGAEYILRWVPRGTHDWRKFVKPSELAQGLKPFGVSLHSMQGIGYDPLHDNWFASDDLDVNYLASFTKN